MEKDREQLWSTVMASEKEDHHCYHCIRSWLYVCVLLLTRMLYSAHFNRWTRYRSPLISTIYVSTYTMKGTCQVTETIISLSTPYLCRCSKTTKQATQPWMHRLLFTSSVSRSFHWYGLHSVTSSVAGQSTWSPFLLLLLAILAVVCPWTLPCLLRFAP